MAIITPETVQQLYALDPIFMEIKNLYGVPENWQRPPGFISLCRIVLEQQVSLESAFATYKKLLEYVDSDFTPQRILQLDDVEMRECYVSRQKASYLRNIADAVLAETLIFERLEEMSDVEVHEYLTKIKGIGKWTANVYLIFVLQRRDILPLGDIAVVNTVKELKGATNKEEVGEIGAAWQPLRTVATFFLWHYYLNKRKRNIDHIYAI
ncbi:MAG: DNA-3-methyladenine glycosylase [Saprospiraceae bacterium]